ncbi:hypothetical protein ACTXT7_004334 [Hymenolepis weldensis]
MGRLCPPRCPGYDSIFGSIIDCSAGLNSGNIMDDEAKTSLKRMDELLKGVEIRIFSFCKRDDYVSFNLSKDGKYFKMNDEEQEFVNDAMENYRIELKYKAMRNILKEEIKQEAGIVSKAKALKCVNFRNGKCLKMTSFHRKPISKANFI